MSGFSEPPAASVSGSPPPRRRVRPLRVVLAAAAITLVAAVAVTVVAASRLPESYARHEALGGPAAEQAARRFLGGVSRLHADFIREGAWEAAFSEDELNAWLAVDLPRNHPHALPGRVREPRVSLQPRRVDVSARLVVAGLRPVVSVGLGVRLREPNQLGVTVEEASLGAIPLPRGPVLSEIRRRFDRLGMVTSVQRLDDRSVLVVYIPSTHESGGMSHWLESLSLAEGSVAVAGRTLAARTAAAR
ncbi:MAG: hypothetical protein ACKO6E_05975 [Planctomycetota bacterium]